MKIDASFLETEYAVLCQHVFSEKKFAEMWNHPFMTEYMEHEKLLGRTATEGTVRAAFEAAITGGGESSLFPERIKEMLPQLQATAEKIQSGDLAAEALERIHRFTDCEIGENTTVSLYALGKDGGFSLREEKLAINLLWGQEPWFDVLCHELYHARSLNAACVEKRIAYIQLTGETDDTGEMILSELAEEGIATLIQRGGKGVPSKEEVSQILRRLQGWKAMELQERKDFYRFLSAGPQRYLAASYLADRVLRVCGKEGLEQWSAAADLTAFYRVLMQE